MFKRIVSISFFLLLIHPFSLLLAQNCNDAIPATTSHFQDNNNGTISDPKTGLIWKKCSEGQHWLSTNNSCEGTVATYTWRLALQQTETVNNGNNLGQTDWRVPNIKELSSIVERRCSDPSLNPSVFPSTSFLGTDGYWSSSVATHYSNDSGIWHVHFNIGNSEPTNNRDYSIRLVRGQ
jgi:hypothetical protein